MRQQEVSLPSSRYDDLAMQFHADHCIRKKQAKTTYLDPTLKPLKREFQLLSISGLQPQTGIS
jgi:hypothetical protein